MFMGRLYAPSHPHRDRAMAEERQRLLNVGGEGVGDVSDGEGGTENGGETTQSAMMTPSDAPPTFTHPPPALTLVPPRPPVPPPTPFSDPPPKYAPPGEAPPYTEPEYLTASGMGVPVQIQVEGGRTVQATLVQEVREGEKERVSFSAFSVAWCGSSSYGICHDICCRTTWL